MIHPSYNCLDTPICDVTTTGLIDKMDTHQPFGHGRLVVDGQVLLQGEDDAVGDDGGEDHVLEGSGRVQLRETQCSQFHQQSSVM